MKRVGFIVLICSALASACDFGALDALNTEQSVAGSDELTNKSYLFWRGFAKDDDAVRAAVRNFDDVVARAGELPVKVTIGRLPKEDLAAIGFDTKADPASAQGMLVISELDCSLDQISKMLTAKNQPALYPQVFDTYDRTYKTNIQDFLGGAAPQLDWSTTYSASALGVSYESTVVGSARHVANATSDGQPVLIGRLYLDGPAKILKGDDTEYLQDYESALYYPRGENKVLHFYAIWRQLHVSGLSSDSDFYIASTLGGLIDFEKRTSKVCRDGQPQPTF